MSFLFHFIAPETLDRVVDRLLPAWEDKANIIREKVPGS
jgi:hypothetical protein